MEYFHFFINFELDPVKTGGDGRSAMAKLQVEGLRMWTDLNTANVWTDLGLSFSCPVLGSFTLDTSLLETFWFTFNR